MVQQELSLSIIEEFVLVIMKLGICIYMTLWL